MNNSKNLQSSIVFDELDLKFFKKNPIVNKSELIRSLLQNHYKENPECFEFVKLPPCVTLKDLEIFKQDKMGIYIMSNLDLTKAKPHSSARNIFPHRNWWVINPQILPEGMGTNSIPNTSQFNKEFERLGQKDSLLFAFEDLISDFQNGIKIDEIDWESYVSLENFHVELSSDRDGRHRCVQFKFGHKYELPYDPDSPKYQQMKTKAEQDGRERENQMNAEYTKKLDKEKRAKDMQKDFFLKKVEEEDKLKIKPLKEKIEKLEAKLTDDKSLTLEQKDKIYSQIVSTSLEIQRINPTFQIPKKSKYVLFRK